MKLTNPHAFKAKDKVILTIYRWHLSYTAYSAAEINQT